MFSGDGGRIVKVKVKKDNYARAFRMPTKNKEHSSVFSLELESTSSNKNYRKMIITSKLYN